MFKTKINAKTMPILLISLLSSAILAYQVKPAGCLPANSMWIEPALISLNSTTPVGFRFNVTIYTNLSVSTYAWQIYLTYNKNHLNVTGCWYSAGAKSQWAGTNPTSPLTPQYGSHNATHNYVLFGESLQGQVSTPPGVYTLAIIQFAVVAVPPGGQVYHSELRLNVPNEQNPVVVSKVLNYPERKSISLSFGGTVYIIDEFTLQMLLIFFTLSLICIFMLKRRGQKQLKHAAT
ncbi:MAG: hypothetical protein QXD73_06295 [Candidatus Bathyarchaeia archaeon]